MALDVGVTIPELSAQSAAVSEIDKIAPDTVLILAMNADGQLVPISTGKFPNVRRISEADLQAMNLRLDGFPDQFAITKVEGREGCRIISGSGGAIFIPC